MKIQIDAKEQDRIEPAKEYYTKKKQEVTVEDLPVGDYIFNEEVVFEYKTFRDFIDSIIDKRVFNQSLSQMEMFPYHFVVLELGKTFNLQKELNKYRYEGHTRREFYDTHYYGVISRLNTYTTVLPIAGDKKDCFRVMLKQAEKCLDEKILIKFPEVKTANSALNFLCNDVRGINMGKAKPITDGLGLTTLEDLLNLTKEDLVSINGIGEKTANNILNKIRMERSMEL